MEVRSMDGKQSIFVLTSHSPDFNRITRTHNNHHTYIMAGGISIRNTSGIADVQCFVSNYSGGKDDWVTLPHDFKDPHKCHWNRKGYELVVFKNPANGKRRGWYLKCHEQAATLYVTFMGFEQQVGLYYH
ncbi:hypothetical protein VNI00_009411 [Paramarasmius palmivorus]|uniref:Uncharacterized protein n=1 Tax=Paramarasmius palmivorus TaxID=297713 RepID=A0AAW0CQB7_9AGAR